MTRGMIHGRHSDRLQELIELVIKELVENAQEFSSDEKEQEIVFYQSMNAFVAKFITTKLVDRAGGDNNDQ